MKYGRSFFCMLQILLKRLTQTPEAWHVKHLYFMTIKE